MLAAQYAERPTWLLATVLMGKRVPLLATDDIEQRLLEEVAAAPDGRRRAALEALELPRRDRIDDMWRGSPMRVGEARRLASWLGYDLRIVRVKDRKLSPAWADAELVNVAPAQAAAVRDVVAARTKRRAIAADQRVPRRRKAV